MSNHESRRSHEKHLPSCFLSMYILIEPQKENGKGNLDLPTTSLYSQNKINEKSSPHFVSLSRKQGEHNSKIANFEEIPTHDHNSSKKNKQTIHSQ